MNTMTTSRIPDGERQNTSTQRPAPARPWTRPVLVEYGHLAKLTRGGSGLVNESGGKKAMCL